MLGINQSPNFLLTVLQHLCTNIQVQENRNRNPEFRTTSDVKVLKGGTLVLFVMSEDKGMQA